MKTFWSLIAALALGFVCIGPVQADELSSFLNSLSPTTPQADPSPMTFEDESPVRPTPMAGVCQPGTFQYNCKEIWGVAQGRCGANTWRYTSCKQYRDPAGKWYYQYCGTVQEVCSPPGGAECIPCS